jgi:hypothetical protein
MKKASPTNNLKFLYPEIAKEFHPTKNGSINPENLMPGSNFRKYWGYALKILIMYTIQQ